MKKDLYIAFNDGKQIVIRSTNYTDMVVDNAAVVVRNKLETVGIFPLSQLKYALEGGVK